ncbi:hypothetical protein [Bernardetia sp. MNP-M8]|uniref:hypothetical protein n=1 Tax=Bernardetia sp. MNP-M8 TaxID=3127470 RepID=UPI0030D3B4F6
MKTTNLKYVFVTVLFFLNIQIQAATIYVDVFATGTNNGTTWTDAYTDLQTAITQSTYGDVIRVSEGIYTKSSSYTLKDGVKIYGGYPNSTSIPFLAQYPHHRNSLRNSKNYITTMTVQYQNPVILNSGTSLDSQTIVDGVKIRGKYALNIGSSSVSNATITPLFNSCDFEGDYSGGDPTSVPIGININDLINLVKPSFINCTFSNFGLGVKLNSSINSTNAPQFIKCKFFNLETGVVIGNNVGNIHPLFDKCDFYDIDNVLWLALRGNTCSTEFEPLFLNSIFYNNETILFTDQGSTCDDIAIKLSNCTLFDNGTSFRYPIYFWKNPSFSSTMNDTNSTKALRLENCISWNNLNTNGDLMSIDNGMYVEIENTLLEANSSFSNGTSSDPVFVIPNGHPTINRVRDLGNCIYNQNPMFVNPSTTGIPNLKLQNTSPARNAGNNTFIPTGVTHDYGNTYR